eukprot:6212488-Pleurochrysis_carterae.AAC.2
MLRRTAGKMVYELRPSVNWNKGKAVEWLLEQIKKEKHETYMPIYIGDDVTDEDAFQVMDELGGFGIIVHENPIRDNTAASFALRNPSEVQQFLEFFAYGKLPQASEADRRPFDQPKVQLLPPPLVATSKTP